MHGDDFYTAYNTQTRLEEQRGHVRKASHTVKQQMQLSGRNINPQLDQSMLQILIAHMDVAEFYSPPRVANLVVDMGFRAGWGMDITTNDTDGREWDFNVPEMRNRAVRNILTDRPLFLIGSPMCTVHSVMNKINHARIPLEVVKERFAYAQIHLTFAAQFYKLQVQGVGISHTSTRMVHHHGRKTHKIRIGNGRSQ